jgi:hypothetical protein
MQQIIYFSDIPEKVRYFKPLVYKEKPGTKYPAFLFSTRRLLARRRDGNKKAIAMRSIAWLFPWAVTQDGS